MAKREHNYRVDVRWTGNRGTGTSAYAAYGRDHEIAGIAAGKPPIAGSSDPAFRGDACHWNPEELFLASVVVAAYIDWAEGVMTEKPDGLGEFTSITLRPEVVLARAEDMETARKLHADAHAKCFIANSIKTPVAVDPTFRVGQGIEARALSGHSRNPLAIDGGPHFGRHWLGALVGPGELSFGVPVDPCVHEPRSARHHDDKEHDPHEGALEQGTPRALGDRVEFLWSTR